MQTGCILHPVCTQKIDDAFDFLECTVSIYGCSAVFRRHCDEKTKDITAACAFCLAGVIACV